MERKGHAIISLIATIPFITSAILLARWLMIPRYIWVWFNFCMNPDNDHAWKMQHRNFLFHSLLNAVFFTLFFWGVEGTSFALIIVGIHLLCDVYQSPGKKRVGSYNICYPDLAMQHRIKRFKSTQTVAWLMIQGIIGIAIGIALDVGGTFT